MDVVAVLTESPEPRKYWSVLKSRIKKESDELTTICSQLKMPSKIGFIVAIAQKVLGRAGAKEKSPEEQDAVMKTINDGIDMLVAKFQTFTKDQMADFLLLDSLNEALARIPKKNIGNRQSP